jgi:uncharacterized RDD family membrane protein YckC
MKCPKCGYLGFEHVERCRNCGYDFSLTSAVAVPELPIRSASNTPHPLDDLTLIDAATAPASGTRLSDAGPDVEAELSAPIGSASVTERSTADELPLFARAVSAIDDDRPLISAPSPPRAPLAVRRATPEIPRVRAEQPRVPSLDLALDLEVSSPPPPMMLDARAGAQKWAEAHDAPDVEDASLGARLAAVAIDLLILAAVDAVVIYFTLRICGITIEDVGILPKVPLVAFLFVQNAGYLAAFTAGGQTLGKVAVGIRVVASDPDEPLDLGRAVLRTLMWLVLAGPAGLGFLTAAMSRDHRGLHDRFAGTRVVR